jgi:hypothetical protein
MKYLFVICLFIVGCGQVMETVKSSACSVTKVSSQSFITCPDGTSTIVNDGTSGPVGENGNTGPKGDTGATGPQGSAGYNGSQGSKGDKGDTGSNGTAGINGVGFNPGLQCDVYTVSSNDENGTISWNTLLSNGILKFTTVLTNFNVPNESSNTIFATFTSAQQALIGTTNYALDCSGYLNVPETGSYVLSMGSDDGSELALDEVMVINMPQLQAYTTKNVTVSLFSGRHVINVLYFQGPATNIGLTLSWQGPSNNGLGTMSVIPSSYFTH